MKKIAVCLALVALAGCSKTVYVTETTKAEEAEPETTVDVPDTTKPPVRTTPAPTLSDEDMYVLAVHNGTDMPIYISDYELIESGWLICNSLDAGMSPEAVLNVMFEASYQYGENMMQMFAAIGAGATVFLCPWHNGVWSSI